MKTKISSWWFLLLVFFVVGCKSVDKYNQHIDTEIPVEKVIEDINYVEKQLFKKHPDVDWYISKETLHQKFDSLRQTIVKPMKPNEFYLAISPLIASVRQGHMNIGLLLKTYSKKDRKKYRYSKNPLYGYQYIYKDNRLIVKDVYRDKEPDSLKLQIGTEIIAVNGITPQELLKKYRKTMTSDGNNLTMLPYLFAAKANSFYLNEIGFVDSIQMEVSCVDSIYTHISRRIFDKRRTEESEQKKDTLTENNKDKEPELTKEEKKAKRAIEKKRRKERRKKRKLYGYYRALKVFSKELSYPVAQDSTIALLKIRDFVGGRASVYQKMFEEINDHKVEHLIIDLRGNPGGSLNRITKLAAFTSPEDYQLALKPVTNSKTWFFQVFRKPDLGAKIIISPILFSMGVYRTLMTTKGKDGKWYADYKQNRIATPHELAYKKDIYVIIDGLTFSAASVIAAHLSQYPNVTIVGEETGGAHNGTVAGIMPILKLPNTKLPWRLGLMSIKPKAQVKDDGLGVLPDVPITSTIEDIIEHNDKELDWILNKIAEKKKNKKQE